MGNQNHESSWVQKIVALLIAIIVLALVVWGGYSLLKSLFALKPEILAPTLVGFVTVIGSVIAVIYSKRQERKKDVEFQLRQNKAVLYAEFLKMWFDVLFAEKSGKGEVTMENVVEVYNSVTQKLIPWGSDEVLPQPFV